MPLIGTASAEAPSTVRGEMKHVYAYNICCEPLRIGLVVMLNSLELCITLDRVSWLNELTKRNLKSWAWACHS